MRIVVAGLIAAVCFVLVLGTNEAGEKKPKYKIAQVMAKAMKGGLCAKVAKGEATEEEKETLVELFTALHENKPPRGEDEAWKERTKALLEAAKKGDTAALKKAANCMACHTAHKGK